MASSRRPGATPAPKPPTLTGTAQLRDPNLLHPEFRPLIERWLEAARANGWEILITETFRTLDRQNFLYASGRTRPGPILTNTLNSSHRMGLAVDIAILRNGRAIWDTAEYQRLYEKNKPQQYGLETLVPFEWVHIELRGGWLRGRQLGISPDVVIGSRWP